MEYFETVASQDANSLVTATNEMWRLLILIGLGIITGLGLVIVWFIRQALNGRLLGLLSPFIAPLIRMVYDSAIMQRLSSKRLPKMIVPRSWQQFLDMPPEFKARLEVYNDTMIMVKESLYGPYAMCQLVTRLFQEDFSRQLIRRKRDFQRYAEMVREFMSELERFEDNLRQQTLAMTQTIHDMEDTAEENKLVLTSWSRWQRIGARALSLFGLARVSTTTGQVREAQRQQKRTRKQLLTMYKQRDAIASSLFREQHRALIRIGTRLVHFDNSNMSNLMHMLGCALEDIRGTIHSGLIMEMLAADTGQGRRVREELGLTNEDLPVEFDALRRVTKAHARQEMGSKGQMPREDELELYLRDRLRHHPRWGHFARYAAPDGSVGLSAAKYDYIPQLKRYLAAGNLPEEAEVRRPAPARTH